MTRERRTNLPADSNGDIDKWVCAKCRVVMHRAQARAPQVGIAQLPPRYSTATQCSLTFKLSYLPAEAQKSRLEPLMPPTVISDDDAPIIRSRRTIIPSSRLVDSNNGATLPTPELSSHKNASNLLVSVLPVVAGSLGANSMRTLANCQAQCSGCKLQFSFIQSLSQDHHDLVLLVQFIIQEHIFVVDAFDLYDD
jgi:hypothetical protein